MKPLGVLLERRYIKVTALARAAGLPPTSIYKYTSGNGCIWNMSIDSFLAIAHALDMTGEELYKELKAIEAGR